MITRGQSLQDSLEAAVERFAVLHNVTSFDDLESMGYPPTTLRKKKVVLDRVNRDRNPISFSTAWANNFTKDKYGTATTHWNKLKDRIKRGVGNPCPLLFIGIPASIIEFDNQHIDPLDDETAEPVANVANALQSLFDEINS